MLASSGIIASILDRSFANDADPRIVQEWEVIVWKHSTTVAAAILLFDLAWSVHAESLRWAVLIAHMTVALHVRHRDDRNESNNQHCSHIPGEAAFHAIGFEAQSNILGSSTEMALAIA